MRLYLLRHGHALTAQESGAVSDAERPISETGRAEIKASLSELLRRGGRPELILHSPLRRARQTAEIADKILPMPHELRLYEPLGNVLAAEELEPLLKKAGMEREQILAIGHQPQLGDLAALFSGREFDIRTGGLVALETNEAGAAKMLWSYNPG
ncbi:MAG TPA: histidine phosphatase family protein [Elusimicrobiota bacterium]|nr:histidine phosphatase family protein [Elusimicrobiota bacterium]